MTWSRRRFAAACAVLGLAPSRLLVAQPAASASIEAMAFSTLSAGAALPPWLRPQAFEDRPRRTEFSFVADAGVTVLRARADASTAGLVRALRVDPATHPILAWRWKVAKLIEKSDLATKAGDDFPVRLYLTFDLPPEALSFGDRMGLALARSIWGEDVPAAALCYVWDHRAPVGTMAPNAYTDRVRMVVADSGAAHLGQWRAHRRDLRADYRQAFGLAAGAPVPAINSVIVSSDTDNTGERSEAWFGDVRFFGAPG